MARGDQQIHYRKPTSASARSNTPFIVYFLVAAVVAFMFVFGLASVVHSARTGAGDANVSSEQREATAPQSAGAQSSANADVASSGGEGGGESGAVGQSADGNSGSSAPEGSDQASANPADLSGRDAELALDPSRTDWNYDSNGRKTVYLTIDDGPSELTSQVLDILDRYNAKATFFVVGHNSDCYPMISEAYRRGHTIGLHTFTHDYAEVYASTDAYYADLDAIGQVVKEQIGYVPCLIRFPGGSSNAVSAEYTPGIMSALVEGVQERGYQYYDWNASVGDGAVRTTEEVYNFGTEVTDEENIVLLCHDSATKQTTIDALPAIIEFYQGLGYSFEALDRSSWVCHHGVNN